MDSSGTAPWNDRIRQERLQRNWRQRDVAERLDTTTVTVTRWEQGHHLPSAYFRLKLCILFSKSAQEMGFVQDAPPSTPDLPEITEVLVAPHTETKPLWNVPYPRNPFFTGREETLHKLHEQLHRQHATALAQPWAISGLGGIGKTQIALEYAYWSRQDYRFIFWTHASSSESLLADLVHIADLLQLPERLEQDQKNVLPAVKRWFATHSGWLWILDNADDVHLVQQVIPEERPGHLLLTTRAQALGPLAQRMEIETMGLAEGTLFLLRRARILSPDAFLDQVEEEVLATAEAIVLEMDALPLALDQAGAYIEEIGCGLTTYRELYRTHRQGLLQRRGRLASDHPESVTTTWSLSFQRIKQLNPVAAELFRLCVFLEPDKIPEELFNLGSTYLGELLGTLANDPLMQDKVIETLRAFSLIQRQPETNTLHIHRLVQAVLRDEMEEQVQRIWVERVIRAVNALFPQDVDAANWQQCRRMLSQAQNCASLIQDYELTIPEAAILLAHTGNYLTDHALFELAESLFKRAVSIWEQTSGIQHPDAAMTLHGLALLNRVRGRYEQAEQIFQQALSIREQTLGQQHLDVAFTLYRLAELNSILGKYEQAESLFQRTLSIIEHNLGKEHPTAVATLNGLVILYRLQSKYQQAEPLAQRALQIQERVLKPDHPDIARALSGLANLYIVQNKYELAEPLCLRILSIWEQALGPDHPHVATSLNNLALLYQDQQRTELAEPLYQRALSIGERVFGPDHPRLAITLNNLAELYTAQGKYSQGEALYQRAISIWEKAFGQDHPNRGYSLNGLANLYCAQRKYEQAEALYQQAIVIREQALGTQHTDTAESFHDLAVCQETQGKFVEAASLYQRAQTIREQLLGNAHPKTCETRKRLQAVLQTIGSRGNDHISCNTLE